MAVVSDTGSRVSKEIPAASRSGSIRSASGVLTIQKHPNNPLNMQTYM
jgi:hypothetical protein